jgi:hypothetical protein
MKANLFLGQGSQFPEMAIDQKELKATTVLSVEIDQASSKIRTGPPKDDAEDYDLDVWAGVLPLNVAAQPPIDDNDLKAGLSPSKIITKYSI